MSDEETFARSIWNLLASISEKKVRAGSDVIQLIEDGRGAVIETDIITIMLRSEKPNTFRRNMERPNPKPLRSRFGTKIGRMTDYFEELRAYEENVSFVPLAENEPIDVVTTATKPGKRPERPFEPASMPLPASLVRELRKSFNEVATAPERSTRRWGYRILPMEPGHSVGLIDGRMFYVLFSEDPGTFVQESKTGAWKALAADAQLKGIMGILPP